MESRQKKKTQKVAAAQAGFSERSARNIEKRDLQPARNQRNWRTRKDPFDQVWQTELVPLLEKNPDLQAVTLLETLQEKYEKRFSNSLLRTLQRRVRRWKALFGPSKEVIFRQNHRPGEQGISDFTHMKELGITIQGDPLDHMLYHYRLTFSGWEYAQVVLGGESFTALAENLQSAFWSSGGVPKTHRTDSLSAAFKNLTKKQQEDMTKGYQDLCEHYGVEATRNNRGKGHENGTIESSHRHLKSRINQALMIRGSRDFESLDAYRQFVRELVHRYNKRVHNRYMEELSVLQPLPESKTVDFTEERAYVTKMSTIRVKEVIYSVPSRLIGMTLKIHIYDDRLECFVGLDHVVTLNRRRRNKKHIHQIDYRHIIDTLVKKPAAMMGYIYQDELFPTLAFRRTWDLFQEKYSQRKACRDYIAILKIASQEDREEQVSHYLERELLHGRIPEATSIQEQFFKSSSELPTLIDEPKNLASYAQLLVGGVQ